MSFDTLGTTLPQLMEPRDLRVTKMQIFALNTYQITLLVAFCDTAAGFGANNQTDGNMEIQAETRADRRMDRKTLRSK